MFLSMTKGRDARRMPRPVLVCLLLLYRLYAQASLVILDPRAELERLRMLKEYELGGDVLQGDQFAPLASIGPPRGEDGDARGAEAGRRCDGEDCPVETV
jgi:hypothetical protein